VERRRGRTETEDEEIIFRKETSQTEQQYCNLLKEGDF
jgi:hypothetical protein